MGSTLDSTNRLRVAEAWPMAPISSNSRPGGGSAVREHVKGALKCCDGECAYGLSLAHGTHPVHLYI